MGSNPTPSALRRPWFMFQSWQRLLFAHWPVATEALAPVVPPQLEIDTFGGRAWVAVTPFEVRGFRVRFTPPLPGVSAFNEINVRTYVTVGGRPGIFFFSLDADSRFAVIGARRTFRVPYFAASMRFDESGFRSERTSRDGPAASFRASYGPAGARFHAARGSLEYWLTERYRLYTLDRRGRVLSGEILHPPWPLQPARAQIEENTMGRQVGIELEGDPLLHYAARQDVIFWRLAASVPGSHTQ